MRATWPENPALPTAFILIGGVQSLGLADPLNPRNELCISSSSKNEHYLTVTMADNSCRMLYYVWVLDSEFV